jgi:CheY-like chemotaxis protein
MVRKLLVVDDNAVDLRLHHLVLEKAGYEVWDANSAEQALEILRTRKPDAILTDLNLPRMDGLTLARQLKKLPETASIPVIAVTGAEGEFSNREAYKAGFPAFFAESSAKDSGAVAYLSKPIDVQRLAQIVAQVTENSPQKTD